MNRILYDPIKAEKAKQEGALEGRREGKLEVAQALLRDGMDYEKVKNLTGLTNEELKALKH